MRRRPPGRRAWAGAPRRRPGRGGAIAWSARSADRLRVAAGGEVLEGADADMACGHARQHGAGLGLLAIDRLAGGHRHQGAGRRDAEGGHGLADDVLAQHRAERGAAVAAARERRPPGPLEVDVAADAVRDRRPRRGGSPARRRAAARSGRTGARHRPWRSARLPPARDCRRSSATPSAEASQSASRPRSSASGRLTRISAGPRTGVGRVRVPKRSGRRA